METALIDGLGLEPIPAATQPGEFLATLVGGDTAMFREHSGYDFWDSPKLSVYWSANMHDGGGDISLRAHAAYFVSWYLKWPGWLILGLNADELVLRRQVRIQSSADIRCKCLAGGKCVIYPITENCSDKDRHGRLSAAVTFQFSYVSESTLVAVAEWGAVIMDWDPIKIKPAGTVAIPGVPGIGIGWELDFPSNSREFHKRRQWTYTCVEPTATGSASQ